MSENNIKQIVCIPVSSDISLVSDELKSMIITAVQANSFLYRITDINNKDEQLKDATWTNIGLSLPKPFTGEVVKKVFSNLKNARSYHRNAYEAAKNACIYASKDKVPEPTWPFWKQLSFLEGNVQRRSSRKRKQSMLTTVQQPLDINTPTSPTVQVYAQQYAQQMQIRQDQLQQHSSNSSSNVTQINETILLPAITVKDLNQGIPSAQYIMHPIKLEADETNSCMSEMEHMIEEQNCSEKSLTDSTNIVQTTDQDPLRGETVDCTVKPTAPVWKSNHVASNKQSVVSLPQIPDVTPSDPSPTNFCKTSRTELPLDDKSKRLLSLASSVSSTNSNTQARRSKNKSSGMYDDVSHVANAVLGVAQEVSRAVSLNNNTVQENSSTVCATGRWVSDQLKSIPPREQQRIGFLIIELVIKEIRNLSLVSDTK